MSIHLDRAKNQIKKGKPLETIKASLELHFEEIYYNDWLDREQLEYNKSFKTKEVDSTKIIINNETQQEELISTIDYELVDNSPLFEDWIDESVITKEAVYINNEDGTQTLLIEEEIEKIRHFTQKDNFDLEIKEILNNDSDIGLIYTKYIKKIDKENLETLVIDIDIAENKTISLDAGSSSLNYLSSVLALGNYEFNKQLCEVMPDLQPLFEAVYVNHSIKWKNAQNKISDINIKLVAEALHEGMKKISHVKTD